MKKKEQPKKKTRKNVVPFVYARHVLPSSLMSFALINEKDKQTKKILKEEKKGENERERKKSMLNITRAECVIVFFFSSGCVSSTCEKREDAMMMTIMMKVTIRSSISRAVRWFSRAKWHRRSRVLVRGFRPQTTPQRSEHAPNAKPNNKKKAKIVRERERVKNDDKNPKKSAK